MKEPQSQGEASSFAVRAAHVGVRWWQRAVTHDIADFCGINPLFGTMQDFDDLLSALHTRNMRLILDFVPNHTSDRHPWFQESRASRGSEKRHWRNPDVSGDGGRPAVLASARGGRVSNRRERRPGRRRAFTG